MVRNGGGGEGAQVKEQVSEAAPGPACDRGGGSVWNNPLNRSTSSHKHRGHGGCQPWVEPAGREGTNLPGYKRGTESHTKEAHRDPAPLRARHPRLTRTF